MLNLIQKSDFQKSLPKKWKNRKSIIFSPKIRPKQKVSINKNMIFVLTSIKLPGLGQWEKKYFEKNFGTKNTRKIRLNSKNLKNQKSKKSDLLDGTTRPSNLYAIKKV
jgi:hypothetical protein